MSDFDKEAERERLREKYERDQQKREASERMSDLLLKGATMTNSHCGNCGDPIFRYDGDEFCPTCQQVVTNDEAVEEAAETDQQGDGVKSDAGQTGDEESATADENGDAPDHIEIKQPDGPAVRTGADQAAADQASESEPGSPEADANSAEANPADATDANATDVSATDANAVASSESQSTPSGQSVGSPPNRQPPTSSYSEADQSAAAGDANDDFAAARASLVRTLRKHAERAENCDDPRRARDHLTAAREAAEALSALSGSY
ncbi:Sjogren's syndrome/scleroderma autoantigen 1 family protein [Halosimplex amylolyticum]|uniref:Sjogren's syndrome/scleroderma autoantigen 1 family protein n=1 Tax=Halosimplex amylolyticum TaxID=3396616 RepID=UPI003F571B03